MTRPCRTCPWRVSTRTEQIPGGGLDPEACRRGADLGVRGRVMQCHCSPDDAPTVCVGYALQVGLASIPYRLLVAAGVVDPATFSVDATLHPTWDAMVQAHLEGA